MFVINEKILAGGILQSDSAKRWMIFFIFTIFFITIFHSPLLSLPGSRKSDYKYYPDSPHFPPIQTKARFIRSAKLNISNAFALL